MKKGMAFFIIMLMLFNMSAVSFAQDENTYVSTDLSGHWAREAMLEWINQGLISGYPDGTYKPDGKITKAEFITLINRAFGYYDSSGQNYSDVSPDCWFSEQTSIAKRNGYMDWYDKDDLMGNDSITRQEVCAIISLINELANKEVLSEIESYADRDSIPEWSEGYIDAVVGKGYMMGYEDNTLRPSGEISRAEAVAMLDRMIGKRISKEGIYGSTDEETSILGNLTITGENVVLRNARINGDLILAAGINDGEVELENVVVEGKTIINGGGENSITFKSCEIGEMVVCKVDGKIRIISAESKIGKAVMNSGGMLSGDFTDSQVEILGVGTEVELEGDFDEISVEARAEIEIDNGTDVELIRFAKEAENSTVDIGSRSVVREMVFESATEVTGKGKIYKAVINADGVTSEQDVNRKIVSNEIDGSGVDEVERERTAAAPVIVEDTTAPVPGNGGLLTTPATSLSAITLSWTKGSDNVSSQDDIEYLAYYSKSNNIDSVTDMESNGTAFGSYTNNINAVKITGLDAGTTYYFNLILKDNAGNKSAYASISESTDSIPQDGTTGSPFRISYVEDLQNVGTGIDGWDLDKCYVLTRNLDFESADSYRTGEVDNSLTASSEGAGFAPIGIDYDNAFTGELDGDGNTIANLYIKKQNSSVVYAGLFGYMIGGEIKDLGIIDGDVTAIGFNTNAIAGILAGANIGGGITDCYATGRSTARIIGSESGGRSYAGGLAGANDGSVINCYAIAEIEAESLDELRNGYAGGLVSYADHQSVISNCYSAGMVAGSGTSVDIGGIASYNYGAISNCYSVSEISGIGTSQVRAGGITGYNNNNVHDSIAQNSSAQVSGSPLALSRIVGNNRAVLNNNYANALMTINGSAMADDAENPENKAGGKGISADEFQNANFYADTLNWDMTNTWEIKENAVRPTLRGLGNDSGQISDISAPATGNSGLLTVCPTSTTSLSLSWTKAVDDATVSGNLEYLAYYSESDNLSSVANIEANGTAIGIYAKDMETVEATGFVENTDYYFNVIVRDQAGNKSAYVSSKIKRMIFDTFEDDLVGIAPTDWSCRYHPDRVVTSEFSKNGSNSLRLEGDPSWAVVLYKSIDITGLSTLCFESYLRPTSNDENGTMDFYGASNDKRQLRISVIGGQIQYSTEAHDNVGLVSIGAPYTVGEWYHVKIVADLSGKTYDIFVDGVKKAEDIDFVISDEVLSVGMASGNDGGIRTIYYDDIKVYGY